MTTPRQTHEQAHLRKLYTRRWMSVYQDSAGQWQTVHLATIVNPPQHAGESADVVVQEPNEREDSEVRG